MRRSRAAGWVWCLVSSSVQQRTAVPGCGVASAQPARRCCSLCTGPAARRGSCSRCQRLCRPEVRLVLVGMQAQFLKEVIARRCRIAGGQGVAPVPGDGTAPPAAAPSVFSVAAAASSSARLPKAACCATPGAAVLAGAAWPARYTTRVFKAGACAGAWRTAVPQVLQQAATAWLFSAMATSVSSSSGSLRWPRRSVPGRKSTVHSLVS
jgi:hypothetical protein